jgi:cytochrome c
MKTVTSVIFVSLLVLSGCGEAPPEKKQTASTKIGTYEELVEKSNCLACHQAGNQMNAPAWKDVAKKYKGDKNAESFLMTKIPHGGSGSWGKMNMPPFAELSEPEIRVLVRAILANDNP